MSQSYFYPAKSTLFEEEIKKSKFYTYLEPVTSKEEALEFLTMVKELYPDARHHCWAYIIGDPNNTATLGMSDDGEPHGTAGKPMLGVLQNKNIGDVIAVTVRYFGGIKLGTGGLVRAYSGGVIGAVEMNDIKEKVELATLSIKFPFSLENTIRHFLKDHELEMGPIHYTHQVEIEVLLPAKIADKTIEQIIDYTNGQAQVSKLN